MVFFSFLDATTSGERSLFFFVQHNFGYEREREREGKKKREAVLTRRERPKTLHRIGLVLYEELCSYYSCPLAFVTSQKDHRRAPSFPLPAARERERESVCVCVCVCVCVRARASEREKREKESARSKRSVEKEEEEEGVREKNWISTTGKEGRFYIELLSSARDVPRLLHGVRVELRSPGYRG